MIRCKIFVKLQNNGSPWLRPFSNTHYSIESILSIIHVYFLNCVQSSMAILNSWSLPLPSSPNLLITISGIINFLSFVFNCNHKFIRFLLIHFELPVIQTKLVLEDFYIRTGHSEESRFWTLNPQS